MKLMDETNVRRLEGSPEVAMNFGDEMVLVRLPTIMEIQKLWKDFNRDFNSKLHTLYAMDYGEIADRWGLLGFRAGVASERRNTPYGVISHGTPAKFANVRKDAATQALVSMGLLDEKTAGGRTRKRARTGAGAVEEPVLALPKQEQLRFLDLAVSLHPDFDSHMKFNQTSEAGWYELDHGIKSADDPAVLLSWIAELTDDFFMVQKAKGEHGSRGRGSGKRFAPAWFAQYLACRGIWLWPVSYLGKIRTLYPKRLVPLLAWMSVPAEHANIAERILSLQKSARSDTRQFSLSVFTMTALGSNMWSERGFRPAALEMFKEWSQHQKSDSLYSTAANHVYGAVADYFDVDVATRPEASSFFARKRLASRGVEPFAWCFDPQPRNTRVAERCLGSPVTHVPQAVKNWALEFRSLLSLFGVKTIGTVEDCMNTWLFYLMTLPEEEVPATLADIDRRRHVHDVQGLEGNTYRDFLSSHFAEDSRSIANRAISVLAQAWRLAADRDKFSDKSNPFDVKLDQVVKSHPRKSRTVRKAMMTAVWQLIVDENRKNGYQFARELPGGRHWLSLLRPGTDDFERIFWPAEPIVIDIILNSGTRLKSARWPDSGEGDEMRVDVESMSEVPNHSPVATRGRREGFLRMVEIIGSTREKIVGMYIASNKTGNPIEVPWIAPEVAAAARHMADLQERFNPIRGPVPARDSDTGDRYVSMAGVPMVYPLFRDPIDPMGRAVTETRVRNYWIALLKHCEPLAEQLLGFQYPLVNGERAVFDIHSLRVTVVTNLLENGVGLDVVQHLVGHASKAMTVYYDAAKGSRINAQLREGFKSIKDTLNRLALGDVNAADEVADEAVVLDSVKGHVGTQMLREGCRSQKAAPFDIFEHGICPGGDCDEGGELISNGRHRAVWRPRACSKCRFRVTGPRFLLGLVNRVNLLSWELRQSSARAKEMSDRLAEIEEQNGKQPALRRTQEAEEFLRGHLADELAHETLTVYRAMALLKEGARNDVPADRAYFPATVEFDPARLSVGFAEVHEFELLHTIVEESVLLPATRLDLPGGAKEAYAAMIQKIMRANGLGDVLMRVDEDQEGEFYLAIGEKLLEAVPEMERMQALFDKTLAFDDVAALQDMGKALSSWTGTRSAAGKEALQ